MTKVNWQPYQIRKLLAAYGLYTSTGWTRGDPPDKEMPHSKYSYDAWWTSIIGDAGIILRKLEAMSPLLPQIILLRYGHGLRYREIEPILKIPSSTLRWQVSEAIKKICAT